MHRSPPPPFADRAAAGRALAAALAGTAVDLVLGLPRGGVVIAAAVAEALGADLDALLVRKIGAPGHAEWGIGALAEDDPPVFDADALDRLRLTPAALAPTVAAETAELHRRRLAYRGGRPAPRLLDRRVLVVDDGLATGVTARAALALARRRGAAWLGFAVPVSLAAGGGPAGDLVDGYRALREAPELSAVSAAYRDFRAVTDAEVTALLRDRVPADGR
ncbi:phosphoribosyltransferase [Pilimelia anulata]|uniref:Phosphoribosyltransferase n=1 Tax=Pilimelia anulata TaxID=53371 RepID=A0A8J3B038_9ACTN|nr:phosphoribosyltransferase family protein [Pilimelia anulata]GGJ79277.1 phosphoribosyltransferase [Pilimelia anulata]